jgi:glycosyltransferase involved in cell wall biosynthesis
MISLITATLHRTAELDRLLDSLESQAYRDFEFIVVDQNPDDRLVPVMRRHGRVAIRHLRARPGASAARNLGLRLATGDIVGFPDDDCWYSGEVLQQVADWFQSRPDGDGLLGILHDEEDRPTGPRWPLQLCEATKTTLWAGGITPVTFLRRAAVQKGVMFDERIGPGTLSGYQSGEDVDFLLRSLESGLHLWHDPALVIRHPSFHGKERILQKSYSYALGGGYILRAHRYPAAQFLTAVVRSLGGAIVYSCKGEPALGWSYLARARGLVRGYVWGSRDLGNSCMRA